MVTIWSYSGPMTRGKNATASAGRRYQAEHDSQIETYQRRVADLVAENKKLTAAIERQRDAHRETVRKLTVQVQEGTSAELAAAVAEVRDLRDERAGMRAERERQDRRVGKFYDNALTWVVANTKMSRIEAVEWALAMQGEENVVVDVEGTASKVGLDADRARLLQKARGLR